MKAHSFLNKCALNFEHLIMELSTYPVYSFLLKPKFRKQYF